MPRLKVTVQVNGRPLRRAYVEHLVFGVGTGMYLTDDTGRIRDEQGNEGIDSLSRNADIRVHCQNSVVRVLNGAALNIAVHQDKSILDGSVVNLNTIAEQHHHYAILNRCLLAYDIVFRQFRPYSDLRDADFPLGRKTSLRGTRDQAKRIEVSFPSQFPLGALAFSEPKSVSTGLPLVHIRSRASDGRLFGEAGQAPTLLASELAHALHFSLFTASARGGIQNDYIGWIATDIANGGSGTHTIGARTSPKVAYIEALDHFASRFAEHVRVNIQGGGSTLLVQQAMTAQIRQGFLAAELAGIPADGTPVCTLDAQGGIVPAAGLNGSDDEGSVFGCIFVDFARRTGLRTAVNAYLRSASAGATTFGEYRTWIRDNRPQHLTAIDAARNTWGL